MISQTGDISAPKLFPKWEIGNMLVNILPTQKGSKIISKPKNFGRQDTFRLDQPLNLDTDR